MESPYPLERSVLAPSSQLSSLARSFASLGFNYTDSSHFISENPTILKKSEIDALITEALIAERAGQSGRSQIYVHQALLLRTCAELDSKNINSFFQALSAEDSSAKESFIKDVKRVYSAIQRKAEKASPQNQGLGSEAPTQKLPMVLSPIDSTIPQNSYSSAQVSQELAHSQTPAARGRNGRLSHTDAEDNLLPPASIRPDPDPHLPKADPIAPGRKTWALSSQGLSRDAANLMGDRGGNGPATTVTGSFNRPTVSTPPRSLPTLHEGLQLKTTSITGGSGMVERLDHREYFPKRHIKHGSGVRQAIVYGKTPENSLTAAGYVEDSSGTDL